MNFAGWSSLVARKAHNLEVGGSNPSPATNFIKNILFFLSVKNILVLSQFLIKFVVAILLRTYFDILTFKIFLLSSNLEIRYQDC